VISVLLPTRGRPDSVARSLESLILHSGPNAFEVLLALDPDDPHAEATRRVTESLAVNTLTLTTTERYGYHQLHRYFNALAERARGDWMLLWNDDATMTTDGWNTAIEALAPEVIVADCWAPPHSPWLITFPAVRRWAVKLVGAFSAHTCHCDTYWEMIGRAVPGGTVQVEAATVHHDRHDLTGGHHDATWQEGAAGPGYRREHFYSEPVQALIRADIEKVRAAHAERFGGGS
jgi:hypothetical protein